MSQTFDRWLRSSAPQVEVESGSRRLVLARVEDRLHERQRTQRRVAGFGVVVAVISFVVLAVDTGQLGSSNRDLVPSQTRDDVLYAPGPGPRERIRTDETGTREFWEQFREHRAARLGQFVSVGFLELAGQVRWSVAKAYIIDGEEQIVSGPPPDLASTMDRATSKKLMKYLPLYLQWVEDGTAVELPARRVRVEGRDIWLRVWEAQTPDGILRYGNSMHVPD
jgi:hypothetical protein